MEKMTALITSTDRSEVNRTRLVAMLLALILAVTGLSLSPTPVSAAEESENVGLSETEGVATPADTDLALDPALVQAALEGLRASDVERHSTLIDGTVHEVYTFDEDVQLVFELNTPAPGMITPMLGAGWDSTGAYVSFNQTDQAVIAGGGGAALGVVICATGVVPACIIAAALVGAATTYIGINGLCGAGRQLYIYVTALGYPVCRN